MELDLVVFKLGGCSRQTCWATLTVVLEPVYR